MGPIARVLVAVFQIGVAVTRSARKYYSACVRRGCVVLAMLNLALVSSLFFGMDAADFYAANG